MKSSRRSTFYSYLAASGLLYSAALVGARGGTFSQAAAQENDALSQDAPSQNAYRVRNVAGAAATPQATVVAR